VVFVYGSKAASAGFFITIAADVAVMAPGTRMGAAHPVAITGDMPKDSPMMAKIENDAAAYVRSLAANRGRNPEEAQKAVRESSAYTEREALDLHLIDYICNDEEEILKVLDGTTIRRFNGTKETLSLGGAHIVSLDMSASERFLSILANPAFAALLFFVGLLGLYIEFTHPGMVAPGLIGGVCLLLFAFATQALPINWVGVALVVLGIVMFLLEIKVVSYGFLTLGGIACLVVGSMLLFKNAPDLPGLAAARWFIVVFASSVGIVIACLTFLVIRGSRARVVTGARGLLSEVGSAITDLDPEGRVFVHGEYWNARSAHPIPKGARVRVVGMNNLMLDVEQIH
jgi:membrane-bound serine protease (ClpP class)